MSKGLLVGVLYSMMRGEGRYGGVLGDSQRGVAFWWDGGTVFVTIRYEQDCNR